ncbi:hypothetical protein LTR78_004771 [Recurvomyces mirabilis]|uniref:Uncharacterized protein n=1 Tax=Recurvomyces mirabilis TaxID=574656 RepID=A0AAE1C260_9PEZI|nr:hypothetical protein LTR78_004771 [Recurvomyces mirabilis]KAK5157942.1 hypothetical protein LTS14_003865 [Recurvomyces mirabilis]
MLCRFLNLHELWEPRMLVTGRYTLKKEFHPLCSADKFRGQDFEVVEPALRLLSHLLHTDIVIAAFHAILYADVQGLDDLDANNPGGYIDFREQIEPRERERTRSALVEAAQYLQIIELGTAAFTYAEVAISQKTSLVQPSEVFSPRGIPQDLAEIWSVPAEETSHYSLSGNSKEDRLLSGARATISYSKFLFDDMHEYYKSCGGDLQRLRWVLPWLSFASTLLHELGHALFRMRPKPTGVVEEPAIAPATVSEIGFSLEHIAWDGVLDCCNPEGSFVMTEWPSPGLNATYNHMGTSRAASGAGIIDRTWYLPLAWAQLLFHDDFWTSDGPRLGVQALRAPRISGYADIVEPCTCRLEEKERAPELDGEAIAMCKSTYRVVEDPACKIGQWDYHPDRRRSLSLGIRTTDVAPEGYLMLWDGTLVACQYKTKVERAIAECTRIPTFFKRYWIDAM